MYLIQVRFTTYLFGFEVIISMPGTRAGVCGVIAVRLAMLMITSCVSGFSLV